MSFCPSWPIIIAPPATASPNQPAGVITLVSRDSNGVQAAFGSFKPSVLLTARYVAFQSSSANLVPNDSNNFEDDIFVHDRLLGHTELISRHTNGAPGDINSTAPSILADGRYVAFTSEATTLVDGDTNGVADIFVHDRQEGKRRASPSTATAHRGMTAATPRPLGRRALRGLCLQRGQSHHQRYG